MKTMRKKKGFILREVADQTVIVPTGQMVFDFNCLITLNPSARWIWDHLDESQSTETLSKDMAIEFNIDEATAGKDIEEFLAELLRLEIIEP
jgi:hypothetical protein